MFKLTIKTGNAAFGDDPKAELSRILGEVSERLNDWPDYCGTLFDLNGNRVGEWELTE